MPGLSGAPGSIYFNVFRINCLNSLFSSSFYLVPFQITVWLKNFLFLGVTFSLFPEYFIIQRRNWILGIEILLDVDLFRSHKRPCNNLLDENKGMFLDTPLNIIDLLTGQEGPHPNAHKKLK
jgi:hypothetical protein